MTIQNSKKRLLESVKNGDKMAIELHLANFKERGVVSFKKVLSVDSSERIPALINTADGRYEVLIALTASIKSAMNNLNLRVGFNEDQIIDLSVAIMDQSFEDNLSIEDVLLFLQMLITGKTGKIYDRMDIPTFFERFEVYRQERHEALLDIREEQQIQHKSLGPIERFSDMTRDEEKNAFHEAMKGYARKNNGHIPEG